MSHNHQKKIAVINDLSGFGRCSIAVSMPVISHMGIQVCPLPTSIFSNHTGFPEYFFDDYTEKMPSYIENWKKLGLRFRGITSGFLGSQRQIEIVRQFIEDFKDPDTKVLIDPVMGDNGKPYATYTKEMCQEMKQLAKYADILTPNLTETCILLDEPYPDRPFTQLELFDMAKELCRYGAKKTVISGISQGGYLANILCEKGKKPHLVRARRVGHERSGTGDIFAAILAADSVNGVNFTDSVRKAAHFIQECILATERLDIPKTDGVCFEEVLYKLKP